MQSLDFADLTPLPSNFLNEFTRLTKMVKLDPWAAENHIPSERRMELGRQNRVTALQSMNQSYFPLQSRGVQNDQEQWRGDMVF
jgi:hypothetical protein